MRMRTAGTSPSASRRRTSSAWRPGHGVHGDDIVPPFVVDHPALGDPTSFPGRNWDTAGQRIYDAGCSKPPQPAAPDNDKKVDDLSRDELQLQQPYVAGVARDREQRRPAAAVTWTTPARSTRRRNWGDIIPPYTYVDGAGKTQTFPGYNWTEAGQAIYRTRLRRPRAAGPDAGHADPRVCGGHGRRGSSPTSGTTTPTRHRCSRRRRRTSSHPPPRTAGSPSRSSRVASRTGSRSNSPPEPSPGT